MSIQYLQCLPVQTYIRRLFRLVRLGKEGLAWLVRMVQTGVSASHSDGERVLYVNFIWQNPAFDMFRYKINPPTPCQCGASGNVHTTQHNAF